MNKMGNIEVIAFNNKQNPEQVLIDSMEDAKDAKALVVVMLDKDDYILTGWSHGWSTQRIGLLEIAKHRMMIKMDESE